MAKDGNAYDWGGEAGGNAWDSFSGMSTLGDVPTIAGGNVTDGTNMQTGAGADIIAGANPITGTAGAGVIGGSGNTIDHMDTYMNPYIDNVIGDSQNNAARMNDIMQDQNNAGADAAGAFGGSRHGLTGATVASDIARNQGEATNQLLNQGWNTAGNLAAGHVNQDMARGQALSALDQQNFSNTMTQGRDLSNLQGQDIANSFQDWANNFNVDNTNIGNMFAANSQDNQTLLGQGNAFSQAAKDLYAQGDASVAAQGAAGDNAQGTSQAFMDAAAGIFDGNSPEQILQNLQGALTGSPLTGEGTQTGSRTPSGAEEAALLWGTAGDMMGK